LYESGTIWDLSLRKPYRGEKVLYTSNYIVQTPNNIQVWQYSEMNRLKIFHYYRDYKSYDVTTFSYDPSLNTAATCFVTEIDETKCQMFSYARGTSFREYSITNASFGTFNDEGEIRVNNWKLSSFFIVTVKQNFVYIFDYNVADTHLEYHELSEPIYSLKSGIEFSDLISTS
jgi:hypothetical protein